MHLIVAQKAPLDFAAKRGPSQYAFVRVLVASISYDSHDRPLYEYVSSLSLENKEKTNYLSLNLKGLLPGKYLARVSLLFDASLSPIKTKTATLGYYGYGGFAVK